MATPYVPDPATRETPLLVDEVRALREAGAKVLRDPRVLDHLLARTEATILLNQQEFNRLHRQVAQIAAERQQQGAPTSLDPLTAARFAPPEEIDKMSSAHLRAKHEQANAMLAEIADAQRRVTGRVNAIKFAVATLLEEGGLDEATRNRFLELVRSMPDPEPEPVRVTGFPDPEPEPEPDPAPAPATEPLPRTDDRGDGGLDDLFG